MVHAKQIFDIEIVKLHVKNHSEKSGGLGG